MQGNEVLRDPYGVKIGEVRFNGSQQALYDPHGHFLGRYDSQDNFTRDDYGKVVGRGNLLTTLLK